MLPVKLQAHLLDTVDIQAAFMPHSPALTLAFSSPFRKLAELLTERGSPSNSGERYQVGQEDLIFLWLPSFSASLRLCLCLFLKPCTDAVFAELQGPKYNFSATNDVKAVRRRGCPSWGQRKMEDISLWLTWCDEFSTQNAFDLFPQGNQILSDS